jgi:two-component system sensor histidine kinase VicK
VQHCFVHDFPSKPLVATVDSKRIEQVLRNLLTNAIKYSPEGGHITVQGRGDHRQLLIQVRDEGMGIPPEDLERVFERFYRVENEITQRVGGVGLGLAVCRAIVEAHGGRMWVESSLGVGSTFFFTLPAKE